MESKTNKETPSFNHNEQFSLGLLNGADMMAFCDVDELFVQLDEAVVVLKEFAPLVLKDYNEIVMYLSFESDTKGLLFLTRIVINLARFIQAVKQ